MTVIEIAAWKRDHARAQCEAITQAECAAAHWVRFWSAFWRDSMRQWWGV